MKNKFVLLFMCTLFLFGCSKDPDVDLNIKENMNILEAGGIFDLTAADFVTEPDDVLSEITVNDDYVILDEPGLYPVLLEYKGKSFETSVTVIDSIAPFVSVSDTTVNIGDVITVDSLIEYEDVSDVTITFDDGTSDFHADFSGVYEKSIIVKDTSGNERVVMTRITVVDESESNPHELDDTVDNIPAVPFDSGETNMQGDIATTDIPIFSE